MAACRPVRRSGGTSPACLQTHQPVERPGNIGVPLPGVTAKLIPDEDGRCELRIAGPNVLKLTNSGRNWTDGVLYDYLRLELAE